MADNPLTLELYREIVDGARDAVLITERTVISDDANLDAPNPKIIYANPAFVRMTGYSQEDVIGQSPRVLQGEKTERDRLDKIRAALRTWEPVRTTLTNYRKDGSEFTVELDIFPSWDGGDLQHWIAIQRDVTHRFDETIALQERVNSERLRSLSAGVAHDFNNLLQIILGFTNLLQIEPPDGADSERQRHLEAIENASRSAADLCSQLLSYAGQKKQDGEIADISETVQQMVELLRASVGKRGNLSVKLPSHLPKVFVDKGQFQQVMLNLVMNAAEACEPDGNIVLLAGELNIDSVSADHRCKGILAPGSYVFIDVIDDGEGISQELQGNVFDPYFSTKGDRGLGLASSLGIVRALRGDIHVNSTVGGGSTFRVLLPVAAESQAKDDSVDRKSPAKRRIVLVVEDQPEIQALLIRVLERYGVDVITRKTGREGLTIAKEFREDIDLVISDVQLPDISGVDVLDNIRQRSSELPVLLISGVASDELYALSQNDEYTTFLAKPFSIKHLQKFLTANGLESAWKSAY